MKSVRPDKFSQSMFLKSLEFLGLGMFVLGIVCVVFRYRNVGIVSAGVGIFIDAVRYWILFFIGGGIRNYFPRRKSMSLVVRDIRPTEARLRDRVVLILYAAVLTILGLIIIHFGLGT